MVRRAILGTPENSISTTHLLFSSLQRSAASGSQKDGPGNMAVNQSAKSSPEHSAHARARVRDIAQRSIARSEGSAVATFNQWQILAVVMSKGIGRSSDLRQTSGWIGLTPEVHCRDKTAVHSEYVQNLAVRKNIPLKALDELVHPDVCHASIFLGHCKRFGFESFLLGAGGFVKHADDRTL